MAGLVGGFDLDSSVGSVLGNDDVRILDVFDIVNDGFGHFFSALAHVSIVDQIIGSGILVDIIGIAVVAVVVVVRAVLSIVFRCWGGHVLWIGGVVIVLGWGVVLITAAGQKQQGQTKQAGDESDMTFFHEHTMKPPFVIVYSMMVVLNFYTWGADFLHARGNRRKFCKELRLSPPSGAKLCYNKSENT